MGTLHVQTSATETAEGKGVSVKLESGWQAGSAMWEKDNLGVWQQVWSSAGLEWTILTEFAKSIWNLAAQSKFDNLYSRDDNYWFETYGGNRTLSVNLNTGEVLTRADHAALGGVIGGEDKYYIYRSSVGLKRFVNGVETSVSGFPTTLSTGYLIDGGNETGDVYYGLIGEQGGVYRVVGDQATKVGTQSTKQQAAFPMLVSPDGNTMYWPCIRNYTDSWRPYRYRDGVFSENPDNLVALSLTMEPTGVSTIQPTFGSVTNDDEVKILRGVRGNYVHYHKAAGSNTFTAQRCTSAENTIYTLKYYYELDNGKCIWLGVIQDGSTRDEAYWSNGPTGELTLIDPGIEVGWRIVRAKKTGPNRVTVIMSNTETAASQTVFRVMNVKV